MKSIYYSFLGAALLLARGAAAQTPAPAPAAEKMLTVSPAVGEVIDGGEKARFGLFMYYAADDFLEASFYRALSSDSAITLRSRMRDGRQLARPFTRAEYLGVRTAIEKRLKELGETVPAAAPVGSGTPGAIAAAPGSTATSGDYNFVLGQTYRIETRDGTTFSGQLVAMSLTALDFDSPALGKVTVQRVNITKVDSQATSALVTVATTPPSYYDIGNGNRMFFAPTGRGLRKGEGAAQDIDLYLLGFNYGITDNFSMGGYLTLFPGVPLQEQFLAFTPKLSVKLNSNVNAAAGLLYLRVPDFIGGNTGVGIGYGALTYGSADNNVTGGLGYAFVDNEIGSTPVLLLGGQRRVSRRVSLVSENYIIADSRGGVAGLYGIKLNWRRANLGLGALYYYSFPYEEDFGFGFRERVGGEFISTYLLPVYIDFTFRFGKGAGITPR